MQRNEVFNSITQTFEDKYLGLGREVGEEFMYSVASYNIQQFQQPEFRIRRHLCLYYPAGWLKSSILMKFNDILGKQNCSFTSDLTLAAMRGSVECGQFVVPSTLKSPFAVATEFGQMVNPDSQDLVQKLLNVLEEGVVSVSLVKIGQLDKIARLDAEAKYPGLKFIDQNTFTYKTNWILFAGTYAKKYLVDNALESRFIVCSPMEHLTPELVKHVNNSRPFNELIDVDAVITLQSMLKENSNIDMKVILPDEVYHRKEPITVRESAQLISYVLARRWYGIDTTTEDIIATAEKYHKNSMAVWSSSEDMIFNVLMKEPGKEYTLEDIANTTRLSRLQTYNSLRKLGVSPYIHPESAKKVYKLS